MVVTCPKCKTRLKVDETRLSPEGSRFKCPKCATVLIVKKPALQEKKALDSKKVLVAHANPDIISKSQALLKDQGYSVIASQDGIDAMVKALKELPFLSIVDVALPKIYGFELCKRLKGRPETKDMKCILISSIYDKNRYRREPSSFHGADDVIEDHHISEELMTKINALQMSMPEPGRTAPSEPAMPAPAEPAKPAPQKVEMPAEKTVVSPGPKVEPTPPKPAVAPEAGPADEKIEKAKRLSRTIINDIYLYNTAKVDETIKNNTFRAAFAAEIKEGLKLYENRIPAEIRSKGDYYNEAIENFIASKK